MMNESFLRDFFGMKAKDAKHQWIVAREYCYVTDNQHPNCPKPLFRQWTEAGWEIVSVTINPAASGSTFDCQAIGVLRNPSPEQKT